LVTTRRSALRIHRQRSGLLGGNINPRRRDFSGAPRRFVFGRLPEFKRSVLETMPSRREGHVTIPEQPVPMTFPSSIHAYCAMNPTPDGKMASGIPQLTP